MERDNTKNAVFGEAMAREQRTDECNVAWAKRMQQMSNVQCERIVGQVMTVPV